MKKIRTPLSGVLVLAILLLCACGTLASLASYAVAGQADTGNATTSDSVKEPSTVTSTRYTKEEYDAVMTLKVDGYEDMTVSAFNTHIDSALFMAENSEYIFACYNKIFPQLLGDEPEHEFILTTLRLSLAELTASISHEPQNFLYYAFENDVEDGVDPDGDTNYSSYLLVPCHINYTISDASTMTVGMRDQAYIEYRDLLQQEIDSIPISEYTSRNLQSQLTSSFERITKSINDKHDGIEFSIKITDVLHKP